MSESRRPRLPIPAKTPTPKALARSLRKRDPDDAHDAAPPPSGPFIRRAQPKDLAAVVALRALMFTAMGSAPESVSANEWQQNTLRWLQVNLGNPDVAIIVADVNGSAVASVIGEVVQRTPSPANPLGRVGMLGSVATFPDYRMTGLGQACVDEVMAWFREETDVSSVELFSTPEGRRRYLPHGFADHPFPHMRVSITRV